MPASKKPWLSAGKARAVGHELGWVTGISAAEQSEAYSSTPPDQGERTLCMWGWEPRRSLTEPHKLSDQSPIFWVRCPSEAHWLVLGFLRPSRQELSKPPFGKTDILRRNVWLA